MPVWKDDGVPNFRQLERERKAAGEASEKEEGKKPVPLPKGTEFDPRDFPASAPPDQEDKN